MVKALYDKTGRQIMIGDTLKVFHFAGARRKRHYMYKYVEKDRKGQYLQISNLNPDQSYYWEKCDGRFMADVEIVQGYAGVKPGQDFSDRKRHTPPTEHTGS